MLRVLSFNAGVSLITKMRRGWGRRGRRNHHRCVYFKEKHRLLFRHLEPCSDRCRRINRQGLREPETADAFFSGGNPFSNLLPVYNKNCRAELLHCPNMAVPSVSSKMMLSLRVNCASQGRIISLMQMNKDTQDICAFLYTPVRASRAVCGLAVGHLSTRLDECWLWSGYSIIKWMVWIWSVTYRPLSATTSLKRSNCRVKCWKYFMDFCAKSDHWRPDWSISTAR